MPGPVRAILPAMASVESRRDIVVVGASAGGVEALTKFVAGLPADLAAAVFVVLHMPAEARSLLPTILSRSGPLPAVRALDGAAIEHGTIYVAAPDRHLLLEPGRMRVLAGPRENGVRPAIDPLFRSAASFYGERVVGIVLSGVLDDGTDGLYTIKRHGGLAIVQDLTDAVCPGMPENAMARVEVDHCLPAAEIGQVLGRRARTPSTLRATDAGGAGSDERDAQGEMGAMSEAMSGPTSEDTDSAPGGGSPPKERGAASGFTCPECRGSLWEICDEKTGETLGFECRVGHRYSLEHMLADHGRAVEAAIWSAINTLEERASLLRKQSIRAQSNGLSNLASRFELQADEAAEHAEAIRGTLLVIVQSMTPEAGAIATGK